MIDAGHKVPDVRVRGWIEESPGHLDVKLHHVGPVLHSIAHRCQGVLPHMGAVSSLEALYSYTSYKSSLRHAYVHIRHAINYRSFFFVHFSTVLVQQFVRPECRSCRAPCGRRLVRSSRPPSSSWDVPISLRPSMNSSVSPLLVGDTEVHLHLRQRPHYQVVQGQRACKGEVFQCPSRTTNVI